MSIEFERDNMEQARRTDEVTRARDEARRKCIESSARELQREGDTSELLPAESEENSMRANSLLRGTKE